MKKSIKNKLAQIFYRPTKEVNGARISTGLGALEKELGKAMDDVFRTDKKKKKTSKKKDDKDENQ